MQISYSFHISSKKNSITTTQKLSSVSKHNMRKYSSKENRTGHYDSEKIVQLVGTDNLFQDVENVYHEQFDQALFEYNKNQKDYHFYSNLFRITGRILTSSFFHLHSEIPSPLP